MREFVVGELRPHAPEWEAAHWFPDEVFGWCAERGYLGLRFEREYGGGEDTVAAAVFAQELARCGSGGLAAGIGAHTSIALSPIAQFGTEEQKRRWLEPGIRGERIAALAITEPDAGSDVAGIRTRAVREDGGYRVNGSKMFITNGVRAELLVTAVKTTDEGGHGGLSFLVVERGEGVESSAIEKLGWHASDTALISLRRRLGARGEPARRGEPRLLPDHGQLPVGAAGDGPRRRSGRWRRRSSASSRCCASASG